MRTHLFFAMSNFAFGEVSLALRLAWQLHARGDKVMFLAPSGLAVLFANTPFKYGQIDAVWSSIGAAIVELAAEHDVASVVVVDAASVYLAFDVARIDDMFLQHLPMPVIALDVWNLPETDMTWDTGTEAWHVPDAARRFTRRLCPVPFIRPDPAPERYNALPDIAPDPEARERARAELGLPADHRLVLTTTGTWQTARAAASAYHRHLVDVVPPLLVSHLARLPERVRVLHVGPEPLATASDVLAARYRWHDRVGADRMRQFLAAADVCVTLNASATTISTAIALDLPVVLGVSSREGGPLAPWHPFAVWPLGLHSFLAPVLRDNPYLDTLSRVELADETAVVTACERLLFDVRARDESAARMASYRTRVRALPSALQVFDGYL